MVRKKWIAGVVLVALGATGGCAALKSAAADGKISSSELVREHQENKEEIARHEQNINELLAEIEKQRKNGNFRASQYREKRLKREVSELEQLDSDHELVTAAPKKLAKLKETYTKEVYERKALAADCKHYVESAKNERMEEDWRYVNGNLREYVKCRRKLEDLGGSEAKIGDMDALYKQEVVKYAEYALGKSEANRKERDFRTARAFEKAIQDHMDYLEEVDADSRRPSSILAKMKKVQQTYRDPREVRAEKAEKAFNAWKKAAKNAFDKEMETIKSAEKKARPDYKAGQKALSNGEYDKALEKFYAARTKLFNEAYPSSVAMDTAVKNGSVLRGLSYEIAAGIAQVHFEQGNVTKIYPELPIIKHGREWLSPSEELKVRLYDILADRDGSLAPKASDPVKRYASRYSDVDQKWKFSKESAEAATGEAYAMLGVAIETVSHRRAGADPDEYAGKVVHVTEKIDDVQGSHLEFDFRSSYKVATKCWSTGEISSVNAYTGQVYYEEKCKYKDVQRGYILKVEKPEGVDVDEGDTVEFYATVGEKQGNYTLNLDNPGYVRVSSKGKTQWYLGVDIGE